MTMQLLIFFDLLRSLEAILAERGFTSIGEGRPLWFLAARERDRYLWRHGLSIADADRFEFWFDPSRFLSNQECAGTEGTTNNCSVLESDCSEDEMEYMRDVCTLLLKTRGPLIVLGAQSSENRPGNKLRVVIPHECSRIRERWLEMKQEDGSLEPFGSSGRQLPH